MKIKPDYGIDAPRIIKTCTLIGAILFIFAILANIFLPDHWLAYIFIMFIYASAIFTIYPALAIFIGSKFFKFRERDWLFDELSLSGKEKILDVGCGRGLLLIEAAKRLVTGKVYGFDLWIQDDQFGNSPESTLRNAEIEGVKDKIEIITGDMKKMPFPKESFDIVVSSWAIHNLKDKTDREKTLHEIARILKPRGKIAILDIEYAPYYSDFFNGLQFENVKILGPRYTFGNKTYLVLATKI